jgi:hypothetical protein
VIGHIQDDAAVIALRRGRHGTSPGFEVQEQPSVTFGGSIEFWSKQGLSHPAKPIKSSLPLNFSFGEPKHQRDSKLRQKNSHPQKNPLVTIGFLQHSPKS